MEVKCSYSRCFRERPLDWTTSARLSTSTIFELVTFLEPSLFMLVLGGVGSPWDEIGMWRDNVKPANHN